MKLDRMPNGDYIHIPSGEIFSSNICPYCHKEVSYPNGVHLRNGKEVHRDCVRKAIQANKLTK